MRGASNLNADGVPIVLPTVEIRISPDGSASVTVDQEPYELPTGLRRDGIRRLVQDLANECGPIRVVILEADGETYIDIATPHEEAPSPLTSPVDEVGPRLPRGPFQPDEDVLVAVVVDQRTPGDNGSVSLRLPPAIAQRYGAAVYLLGQTSHAVLPLTQAGGERQ